MSGMEKKFGILRTLLWPVHRSELKKVVSLLSLLFLLCVSYSILRNLKDTIILTAKHSGAEVLPFLKVWGMLPGAIFATWSYTRLARHFSREAIFYVVLSAFLSYFLFFAFVIHPNSEALHLNTIGDWLSAHLPPGFKGMIAMVRNWTFTTFYIISELWSTVVLGVLFWGFTNEVTKVDQAKRTYGLLNIGSNLAPLLGGGLGILCSTLFSFSSSEGQWHQTLENTALVLAVFGVASMLLFYWINRKVVSSDEKVVIEGAIPGKKQKVKISVRESIRYISKSPYLVSLAILVLSFNIAINITDILWKEQLQKYFTNPNDMYIHMQKITMWIGVFGTVGGTLFSFIVNRLGWTFTAILTPVIMTVMAAGFFVFLFCGDALTSVAMTLFGATPFVLTVYFGSFQNCLSKAGKYSLFDATKELAFLPLDADSRLKGKAAIDGLGSGLGKSGASVMYQGLFVLCGSVAASTPYMCIILFSVLIAWLTSVVRLGRLFKKESVKKPQEAFNNG